MAFPKATRPLQDITDFSTTAAMRQSPTASYLQGHGGCQGSTAHTYVISSTVQPTIRIYTIRILTDEYGRTYRTMANRRMIPIEE